MKEQNMVGASLVKLRAQADALSKNPKLINACNEASFNKELHEKIISNPMEFLRSSGISIPDGLIVDFFEHPPRHLPLYPGPDWEPFLFELTNCRTYWVWECDDDAINPPKCKFTEVEVCFGFRIYPNPLLQRRLTPGPIPPIG